MSNRTAKFVSAIFASLLIGTPLTTVSHSAVAPADPCVSGPKGAPPQGGHWYYRIDRATKRQCWYIGEEKAKLSRVTPPNQSPSKQPQPSIADARAELPMPRARVEQGIGVTAAPANAANIDNDPRANAEGPQRSVIASRWPESSGVNTSAGPGPAAGRSGANGLSNSAALPPTLAAVTLAAADSSSEKPSAAIQMLLIVVIGALSLAGLMGSAIYRFGGTMRWNNGRREIGLDRRAIRDLAGNRPSPTVYAADDPRRRIAAMIGRLSRTSAA